MPILKCKKYFLNKLEILKMRKLLIFAMGIALLLGLALPTPQLKAQVYGDFDMVTLAEGSPYVELSDATVIDPYDFKMYPQLGS
jgi:hypothetical protein